MANNPITDNYMYDFVDNNPYKRVVDAAYDSSTETNKVTNSAPALLLTNNTTLLDAVVATGASASIDMSNYSMFSVQVTKAGTATVDVQASNDGTTWDDIETDVNNMNSYSAKYNYVRVNVSAWTSGAVTAVLFAGN